MDNEFVPFELAVKLKEKGFPQHITDEAYITDNYGEDEYDIGDRLPIPLIPDYMDDVAAPTISQVLKWLREEKCLHIEILHIFSEKVLWDFEVAHIGSYERWWNNTELCDSYEKAALAGIEYVLDNLI